MEKKHFLKAIENLRKNSAKRKFSQSFDVIVNLKQLDLKKPDNNVMLFVDLPVSRGKKVRVGALVDTELSTKAKESCDVVVLKSEFSKFDKKKIKDLVKGVDIFIAQATIMPAVATTFGKTLGPLGKMPNPKAGCVVPPTADLKPLVKRLQNVIKLENKGQLSIKAHAGVETMKDEELADNMNTIYSSISNALPQGKDNLKNVLLKLTMSKPVEVTEK